MDAWGPGGDAAARLGAVDQNASAEAGIEERVVSLYETHRDGIYRFLLSHGLEPARAQEVTQDVFVDLFNALRKGVFVQSEQGWLYAVAGRGAVDYWRRERGPMRIRIDLDAAPSAELVSAEPSPETQAGYLETLRRVAVGLGQLPKEQRMCVQLRMQGLKYREIAKILGVSTSTVAEWLVSAIDSLRGNA